MKKSKELLMEAYKLAAGNKIMETDEYLISNIYLYCLKKRYRIGSFGNARLAIGMNTLSSNEAYQNLCAYLDELSLDEIRTLVYAILEDKARSGNSHGTNSVLSSLVLGLIKNLCGHVLVDFGSGNGNFIANAYKFAVDNHFDYKDLYGVELDERKVNISNMALSILQVGNEGLEPVVHKDVLNGKGSVCTAAYAYPSFDTKLLESEKGIPSIFEGIAFSNRNSIEWVFIDKMLQEHPQRAVAVVTSKALYNTYDYSYRNTLIQRGYIEGIIELPGVMFGTSSSLNLIVFTEANKNERVRLLDATLDFKANTLTHDIDAFDVTKVLKKYFSKDCENRSKGHAMDASNLTPSAALLKLVTPEHGVKLAELAEVFPGSQYTAKNFELSFDKEGFTKILTSKDIEDGIIKYDSLQSIVLFSHGEKSKYDKFTLKKNDVIITSKSSKTKIAVVRYELKEQIIVTGGMIIIRPDVRKINPTFLKMYLESKDGQLTLRSIQKGNAIVSINAKDLSEITIPEIDIHKQIDIAIEYNKRLDDLAILKQKEASLEKEIGSFYEASFGRNDDHHDHIFSWEGEEGDDDEEEEDSNK